MFEAECLHDWQGKDVVDGIGSTIGALDAIYVDTESTTPVFISIKLTGLRRPRIVFVPLSGITVAPDYVRVPFDKSAIRSGPAIDTRAHLTASDEQRLFTHYGMPRSLTTAPTVRLSRQAAPPPWIGTTVHGGSTAAGRSGPVAL